MDRCLIRNNRVYSIPGGWTLRHPALGGLVSQGNSPEDAVASLAGHLRANNIAASNDELWEYANATWRDVVIKANLGDRWMGPHPQAVEPAEGVEVKHFRKVLTPRDFGPYLWGTLHLLPLVFTMDAWMAQIDLMTALISPEGKWGQGCVHCAEHWRQFRSQNPASAVTSAKEAALWGWKAHNAASANAGGSAWTWREAAGQWGWPGEWEPED